MWHLPDGEQQEQRDQFLGGRTLATAKEWDGKHIDNPPEGQFNPLAFAYMSGYDVIDYVSFRVLKMALKGMLTLCCCRRREGSRRY
jgi:hypothetical protein